MKSSGLHEGCVMTNVLPARGRLAVGLAAMAALLAACSSSGDAGGSPTRSAPGSGRSIVVLGHSCATGYNSDPDDPSRDAPANSWPPAPTRT